MGRALFSPKIDENSATPCTITCLNIIKNVTDEPGMFQVEIKVGGGLQEHTWLGFAALAAHRQLGNNSIGMMGTGINTIKVNVLFVQLSGEMLVHAL
jgi:uridylate kinase